jgi:hypothetical protein
VDAGRRRRRRGWGRAVCDAAQRLAVTVWLGTGDRIRLVRVRQSVGWAENRERLKFYIVWVLDRLSTTGEKYLLQFGSGTVHIAKKSYQYPPVGSGDIRPGIAIHSGQSAS